MYITRVELWCRIPGLKVKSKRITYTFYLFKTFSKPSVQTSAVKQDLYLALEEIKNKKL